MLVTSIRGRLTALAAITSLALVAGLGAASTAYADQPAQQPAPTVKVDAAGKVSPLTARRTATPSWPTGSRRVQPWPGAGAATVTLGTRISAAGTLPIALRATSSAAAGQSATVRLWSRATSLGLGTGIDSAVATIATASTVPLQVDLDASAMASNTGGDWLARTHLIALTGCTVSAASITGCTGRQDLRTSLDARGHLHATATPLATSTARRAATTATSTAAGASTAPTRMAVLATATAPAGSTGSYAATPLSSTSSWSAGGQSGSFSWSQPLTMPTVPGGLVPTVAAQYDSGSVDGRVAASNNQPTWLGDGFDLDPAGFIERRYVPCAQDKTGGNNTATTGDNCWKSDNATVSIAGHSGPLVKDKTSGAWRLYEDDGTRFTHSGTTGAAGEYWTMTTPSGTTYTFGKGTGAVGSTATNSAWSAPVYGNQPGEPCYAAGNFAGSVCANAVWRWNLDSIVDLHGNAITFKYAKELNNYGENGNHTVVTYTRGGYLTEIDYGQRTDAPSAQPIAKVLFTTAERCIPDSTFTNCAATNLNSTTQSHWPDVPFDQICTAATGTVSAPATGGCTTVQAPAFFTRVRLTGVTTQVLSGTTYSNVDTYGFTQKFLDPGDATSKLLWTSTLTHTGNVGGTLATPTTTFVPMSGPTANRVDAIGDGAPPINRFRLSWIDNGQGGKTSVGYTATDCTATSKPTDPATNTRRCFPAQYLVPGASTPTLNWFHKYLVTYVTASSAVGAQPDITTTYQYLGTPAWHYDRDDLVPAALRTWGQWRGYSAVRTFVGAAPGPWTASEQTYMRGMNGDCLNAACTTTRTATVTDSRGGTVTDADQDNGFLREERTYASGTPTLDTHGAITSATVGSTLTENLNTPQLGAPTADDGTRQARMRMTSTSSERTYRTNGTYLQKDDSSTYDGYGQPVTEESATTDAGTTCTRTTYANDTTHWIHDAVTSTETVAVPCASTPNRATDLLSADRTLYDGATTWTATPTLTKGDATSHQQLTTWDAATNTGTYRTTTSATFDPYGRALTATDALNHTTATAYTPATGGPVTAQVVTDAATHTTKTTLDPAHGLVLTSTDNNGNVTTNTYDPLGELTGIWLPGRATTATASRTFTYTFGTPTTPSVVTAGVLQNSLTYTNSATYYDSLLRPIEVQTPAADTASGARLVTQTIYDPRGQKLIDYGPVKDTTGSPGAGLVSINDGSVPSRTDYTYDGAGRLTSTAVRSGAGSSQWHTVTTTASYDGDTTTTVPPAGGTPTTTITDSRGHTRTLRQYTTAAGTNGASQDTVYHYRADGLMTSMSDPAGNTWTRTYNLLGQQTSSTDPDAGATSTTYDPTGQTETVTDARGTTLWFGHDALGRKTEERKNTSTGALLASWTYDTATAGIGQPSASTRYDTAGNAYTRAVTGYNAWGQPLATTLTIPTSEPGLAGSYTTSFRYNLDGQIKNDIQPTVPGVPTVSANPGYNYLGQPGNLFAQNALVVAGTTWSAYGQPLQISAGTLNNSIYLAYSYADGTRRLTRTQISRSAGTGYLANTTYTQDDYGNVTKITDAPTDAGVDTTPDTQCFGYDTLQHLTRAWTPSSGDCSAAPATANLGGPAPYWTDWAYDNATSNRTSQTTHSSAGDTLTTYTHPATGSARPHSLTSTTAGAASTTYGYDAAGDQTSSTGTNPSTYTWDDEKHLATTSGSSGDTTRLYDADGNLLITRDSTGSTLYADATTEIRYTTIGGALHATHHYTFLGRTIAVQTDNGPLTYLVSDPHNSTTLAISATNTITSQRRFDPFGNPRGPTTGTWPDAHGFLDQPTDPTSGLSHLGAREYDPTTGRFISVDPLLDLSDPTQWNAYAYANSNPTTLLDPNGKAPTGAGDYRCDNCAKINGKWKFGNETAGSPGVRGGHYNQSHAAAEEQRNTQQQHNAEQHSSNTGDNQLAREAAAAKVAAAKLAAWRTARAQAAHNAAAEASSSHWYNPMSWDSHTWTQVGLGTAMVALTVVNVVQLGADPVTDGLEVAVGTEMAADGAVEVAVETTTEVGVDSAADQAVDVAARRVTLRVGTKASIKEAAPKTPEGDFIDPNTGQVIPRDGPFHYGHKPGFEWWRTQQIARSEGWTRQDVIEFENDPTHYQIEDPSSNMSHLFEMPR